jgi:hypothetical protein
VGTNHRAHVTALSHSHLAWAAVRDRFRAPSWSDAAAMPQAGERCALCWGRWWWTEREAPRRGWRCWCCIPAPVGLAVTEIEA